MSYVNKKERIFRHGERLDIPHIRSESKMKQYWSATDRRAWCDEVELRRQHILELNVRNRGQFCLENFIPLDLLFSAMASNKDAEIEKLQKRIEYLEAMLDIYKQIQLTPEQQRQVNDLEGELAKQRKQLKDAEKERDDGVRRPARRRKKPEDGAKPKEGPKRTSSEEAIRPVKEKPRRLKSEPSRKPTQKVGKPYDKKRPRDSTDVSEAEESPKDEIPKKPKIQPQKSASPSKLERSLEPSKKSSKPEIPVRAKGRGRRRSEEITGGKRPADDRRGEEAEQDTIPKRRKPKQDVERATDVSPDKPKKIARPTDDDKHPAKQDIRPDAGKPPAKAETPAKKPIEAKTPYRPTEKKQLTTSEQQQVGEEKQPTKATRQPAGKKEEPTKPEKRMDDKEPKVIRKPLDKPKNYLADDESTPKSQIATDDEMQPTKPKKYIKEEQPIKSQDRPISKKEITDEKPVKRLVAGKPTSDEPPTRKDISDEKQISKADGRPPIKPEKRKVAEQPTREKPVVDGKSDDEKRATKPEKRTDDEGPSNKTKYQPTDKKQPEKRADREVQPTKEDDQSAKKQPSKPGKPEKRTDDEKLKISERPTGTKPTERPDDKKPVSTAEERIGDEKRPIKPDDAKQFAKASTPTTVEKEPIKSKKRTPDEEPKAIERPVDTKPSSEKKTPPKPKTEQTKAAEKVPTKPEERLDNELPPKKTIDKKEPDKRETGRSGEVKPTEGEPVKKKEKLMADEKQFATPETRTLARELQTIPREDEPPKSKNRPGEEVDGKADVKTKKREDDKKKLKPEKSPGSERQPTVEKEPTKPEKRTGDTAQPKITEQPTDTKPISEKGAPKPGKRTVEKEQPMTIDEKKPTREDKFKGDEKKNLKPEKQIDKEEQPTSLTRPTVEKPTKRSDDEKLKVSDQPTKLTKRLDDKPVEPEERIVDEKRSLKPEESKRSKPELHKEEKTQPDKKTGKPLDDGKAERKPDEQKPYSKPKLKDKEEPVETIIKPDDGNQPTKPPKYPDDSKRPLGAEKEKPGLEIPYDQLLSRGRSRGKIERKVDKAPEPTEKKSVVLEPKFKEEKEKPVKGGKDVKDSDIKPPTEKERDKGKTKESPQKPGELDRAISGDKDIGRDAPSDTVQVRGRGRGKVDKKGERPGDKARPADPEAVKIEASKGDKPVAGIQAKFQDDVSDCASLKDKHEKREEKPVKGDKDVKDSDVKPATEKEKGKGKTKESPQKPGELDRAISGDKDIGRDAPSDTVQVRGRGREKVDKKGERPGDKARPADPEAVKIEASKGDKPVAGIQPKFQDDVSDYASLKDKHEKREEKPVKGDKDVKDSDVKPATEKEKGKSKTKESPQKPRELDRAISGDKDIGRDAPSDTVQVRGRGREKVDKKDERPGDKARPADPEAVKIEASKGDKPVAGIQPKFQDDVSDYASLKDKHEKREEKPVKGDKDVKDSDVKPATEKEKGKSKTKESPQKPRELDRAISGDKDIGRDAPSDTVQVRGRGREKVDKKDERPGDKARPADSEAVKIEASKGDKPVAGIQAKYHDDVSDCASLKEKHEEREEKPIKGDKDVKDSDVKLATEKERGKSKTKESSQKPRELDKAISGDKDIGRDAPSDTVQVRGRGREKVDKKDERPGDKARPADSEAVKIEASKGDKPVAGIQAKYHDDVSDCASLKDRRESTEEKPIKGDKDVKDSDVKLATEKEKGKGKTKESPQKPRELVRAISGDKDIGRDAPSDTVQVRGRGRGKVDKKGERPGDKARPADSEAVKIEASKGDKPVAGIQAKCQDDVSECASIKDRRESIEEKPTGLGKGIEDKETAPIKEKDETVPHDGEKRTKGRGRLERERPSEIIKPGAIAPDVSERDQVKREKPADKKMVVQEGDKPPVKSKETDKEKAQPAALEKDVPKIREEKKLPTKEPETKARKEEKAPIDAKDKDKKPDVEQDFEEGKAPQKLKGESERMEPKKEEPAKDQARPQDRDVPPDDGITSIDVSFSKPTAGPVTQEKLRVPEEKETPKPDERKREAKKTDPIPTKEEQITDKEKEKLMKDDTKPPKQEEDIDKIIKDEKPLKLSERPIKEKEKPVDEDRKIPKRDKDIDQIVKDDRPIKPSEMLITDDVIKYPQKPEDLAQIAKDDKPIKPSEKPLKAGELAEPTDDDRRLPKKDKDLKQIPKDEVTKKISEMPIIASELKLNGKGKPIDADKQPPVKDEDQIAREKIPAKTAETPDITMVPIEQLIDKEKPVKDDTRIPKKDEDFDRIIEDAKPVKPSETPKSDVVKEKLLDIKQKLAHKKPKEKVLRSIDGKEIPTEIGSDISEEEIDEGLKEEDEDIERPRVADRTIPPSILVLDDTHKLAVDEYPRAEDEEQLLVGERLREEPPQIDQDVLKKPFELEDIAKVGEVQDAKKVDLVIRPIEKLKEGQFPLAEQDVEWSDTEKDKDQEKIKKEEVPFALQKISSEESEEFESALEEKDITIKDQLVKLDEEGEIKVPPKDVERMMPKDVDLLKKPVAPCKAKCNLFNREHALPETFLSSADLEKRMDSSDKDQQKDDIDMGRGIMMPIDVDSPTKVRAGQPVKGEHVLPETLLSSIDLEKGMDSRDEDQQKKDKDMGRGIMMPMDVGSPSKVRAGQPVKRKHVLPETLLSSIDREKDMDSIDEDQQKEDKDMGRGITMPMDVDSPSKVGRPAAPCKAKCNLFRREHALPETLPETLLSSIDLEKGMDLSDKDQQTQTHIPMISSISKIQTSKSQQIPDDIFDKQEKELKHPSLDIPASARPRLETQPSWARKKPSPSTLPKDDTTETKKADHKCMAPCRNARDRPTVFGEETGGVVISTDVDTPHDLIPPGYFLPDDIAPRAMPIWADIPEQPPITPETLPLSESDTLTATETDKALWIVFKPEEEILEAPKKKSIPKLVLDWETETEDIEESTDRLKIPENIRMGNVMPKVLSGQVMGLPPRSPLIERAAPQTLTEAIYQRKMHVCKARCAKKKVDKDAIGEEFVDTFDDVSDINTDSETTDEMYQSVRLSDIHDESDSSSKYKSIPASLANDDVSQPTKNDVSIHTDSAEPENVISQTESIEHVQENIDNIYETEAIISSDKNIEAQLNIDQEEFLDADSGTSQDKSKLEESIQKQIPEDEIASDKTIETSLKQLDTDQEQDADTGAFQDDSEFVESVQEQLPEHEIASGKTIETSLEQLHIDQQQDADTGAFQDDSEFVESLQEQLPEDEIVSGKTIETSLKQLNIDQQQHADTGAIEDDSEFVESLQEQLPEDEIASGRTIKTSLKQLNIDQEEDADTGAFQDDSEFVESVQEQLPEDEISSGKTIETSLEQLNIDQEQHADTGAFEDDSEFVESVQEQLPENKKSGVTFQEENNVRSISIDEDVEMYKTAINEEVSAISIEPNTCISSELPLVEPITEIEKVDDNAPDQELNNEELIETEEVFEEATAILDTIIVSGTFDSIDRGQQTLIMKQSAAVEAVTESQSKYVEAIEKMPLPQSQDTPSRFASWFATPTSQKQKEDSKRDKKKVTSPIMPQIEKAQKPETRSIGTHKEESAKISKSVRATETKTLDEPPRAIHSYSTSTEPEYRTSQQHAATATDEVILLERYLRRLVEPPATPCRARCARKVTSKEEETEFLQKQLSAKDAYCAEQRKIATAALQQLDNIKSIVEERDNLRKKLQNSQFELDELKKNLELGYGDGEATEKKKSDIYVPFKESDSSLTTSNNEDIKVLEDEIKIMRTYNLSPEQETTVIKKEVEVLKRYCAKLSSIQEENARLKKCNEELQLKCMESDEKLEMIGLRGNQLTVTEINEKLLTLDETIAERNTLQSRVEKLEHELNAYKDLPQDVEVFKRRSTLLDEVLKDRDRLAKRVEQTRGLDEELVMLKQKSERVEELERQLRLATKDVQAAEDELDSMKNKCAMAEIEMLNQKTETDTLKSRIVCMEHEMESLKSMCKEQELLQIEKERLQVSLDELVRMQDDYEHMCIQMKALDVVKAERDRYKRKYDELLYVENECHTLRNQLDKAKRLEMEKESLERQTEDLEKCICDQEEEIRRLVSHVDCLAKGKEEQQVKMKEVVSGLKIELEKKESLLTTSEEKIATLHGKIDNSFHDLSEETAMLREGKQKLEEKNKKMTQETKSLESNISSLTNENSNLKEKLKNRTEENDRLKKQLSDKDRVIQTMQEVLNDREASQFDYHLATDNAQEIARLQNELYVAKLENQQLQILSTQATQGEASGSSETNYQLKNMLEQSKTAVERIALELEKQYAEWDSKKGCNCCPKCTCKQRTEPKIIIKCCAGCTCKNKKNIKNEVPKCACSRGTKSESSSPRPCLCKDAEQQYSDGIDRHTKREQLPGETTWRSLSIPPEFDDEADEDQMYTARSAEENKARIAKLESELLKANDTVLQLQEQLVGNERLIAENEALRKHSTEVQEVAKDQIKDLANHLKNAKDRINELEKLNAKLKLNLGPSVGEFKSLFPGSTDEITHENSQIENLQNDLKKANKRIGELEAMNCKLKFDLIKARQPVHKLSDTSDAPDKDVDLVTKLQKELDDCLNEREKLLSFIETLKRQLEDIKQDAELPDLAVHAQLKSDLEECLKEKQQLLAELNRLKQKPEDLDKRYDEELLSKLKSDLEACLKEKESLLKLINSLQKQLESGTSEDLPDLGEFAKLKSQLEDCLKEKENLIKTIEALRKQIPQTTTDREESMPKLDDCLKENELLKKALDDLQKRLASDKPQELPDMMAYNKLKAELDNALREKDQSARALDSLKQQMASGKAEDLPDMAALAKLKAELDEALKEKQNLTKALDNLQKEIASSQVQDLPDMAEYATLKSKLEDCFKERENLMKTISDLQKELASKKPYETSDTTGIDKIKAELEKCLKDKESLIQRINDLEKQLSAARIQPEVATADNFKTELENSLKENKLLTQALDELRKQLDSGKAPTVPDIATFAKIKAELEECLKEKNNLLKEIDDLKRKLISDKVQDIPAKSKTDDQSELHNLKAELDKCLKERQELLNKIDNLQKQIAADKAELEKGLKEKEALEKLANDLKINNDLLKKERDDANKMLMGNVMTTSKRSSQLENELDSLANKSKQLQSENEKLIKANKDMENQNKELMAQIAALQNENDKLKAEIAKYKDNISKLKEDLDNLSKKAIDPSILDAINKENEYLKKQLENKKREMNDLLETTKVPLVGHIDKSALDKDRKDKDAMQSTINDLENQLKQLMDKEKLKPIEPVGDYTAKINELMKQLEEAQKRAETAEDSLRKLKASDPTAMMNAEMQKLKDKITKLEAENANLKDALSKANAEKANLKKDLDDAEKDAKRLKDENSALRKTADELKSDKDNMNKDLQKMKDDVFGGAILKEENAKLKKRAEQLEEEIASIKKELGQANAEIKKAADKIDQLIAENSDLKKKLAQAEGENSKIKKNLDAALDDNKKVAAKLVESEKDNAKCKQTVKDLEAEVAKLNKELDNLLNDAKKSAKTISDLQGELAALKQKNAQLESANSMLNEESTRVKKELEQARGGSQVVAGLQDEINKMRQQNASLQAEIAKLKEELEKSNSKLAAATQAQNELENLKKKLQQLETENADLKKKLAIATADKKMDDLQDNYDKLRQKMAEMENENIKLKRDMQKALEDAKKANDELKILKQSENKYKDKIALLEGDNDKLKKELNTSLDNLKKMGTEMSGIQGDESKLKQKVALLETENSKLRKDLEASLENAKKMAGDVSSLKEENSKLKQRIAQLEAENAKLKTDMDSAKNELKKANDQIKQLQDNNDKYKQHIKEIEDDNGKLKQKLDASAKDVKPVADDTVKRLEDERLGKLQKELENARKGAKDNEQAYSQLKEENNQLQQKIKQLETENAKLKKELDDALKNRKDAEAEISRLKDNETKLKNQLAQLEDNNNKLQKEKSSLTNDVKKLGTDLALLSELKDSENKLKQRIAQLEAENAKLKKELDAAQNGAKKLSDELANIKNDNNKLKQQASKVESDNKKLKDDFDTATREARMGGFGIKDLKEVDDKLKQKLAKLEAENAELKSELDKALNNSKKHLGDLSKLQDDDNKLKQKLAQSELDNSKLKKDLDKALNDAKVNANEAADLRNEVSKLKQKVSQLESEIAALKKQLETALNDAKSKTADMSKMQDEINSLKQKAAQLEKSNDNLKKDLESASKDRKLDAKLGDENNKQKQKISQLEDDINKLKKELEAAKSAAATQGISKPPEDDSQAKKLQQIENDNSKLKKELDKALKESQKIASLQDENSKLKQQILKLQSDLDKAKKDLENASSDTKKNATDLARIKESESQLKQKVAQLETENVKLKKELDEMKRSAAEANSLRTENKQLKAQIKQLQDEIDKLKDALKKVESKPAAKDETESLKNEIAALKQTIAKLQEENVQVKQQYDQTKLQLRSAVVPFPDDKSLQPKDESTKLKQRIEQLEQELAKIKKELTAKNEEVAKANENLNKMKQEIAKLNDDNTKLKNENSNLKNEYTQMENELKRKKDALNNVLKTMGSLDGKDVEKLISDYENQIKSLEMELEKQKKECQDTIASLKAQFDRDMKNLLRKNDENIDKLQKAHANAIADLNDKHGKEVKDLRNIVEKLRQELEAVTKERDRLRNLLDDQKRKSIDIKEKVEEVEKVIHKERRRSKELEKQHSELKAVTSVFEEEIKKERKKSISLQEEVSNLEDKLQESFTQIKELAQQTKMITSEKEALAKDNQEIKKLGDILKKDTLVLQKIAEDERRRSKILESDIKMKEAKMRQLMPIPEGVEVKTQIPVEPPKERKLKDEKLTMATFETISFAPSVIPITIPFAGEDDASKKYCPCGSDLDKLFKKASHKGLGALTIEEMQFIHRHLNHTLEKMGQKPARAAEMSDRQSLLRRIAELEGDLMRKQRHTQQKISQMQNAVRQEKDKLTELRKNLEKEKRGAGGSSSVPRKRLDDDSKALERMESQLEQRLKELSTKMKPGAHGARPSPLEMGRLGETPVRDISRPDSKKNSKNQSAARFRKEY